MFDPPRYTPEAFQAAVQAKLPGVPFEMLHRDDTYMVEMRMRRVVEQFNYAVSDLLIETSAGAALEQSTLEAIKIIRTKAIADYGLQEQIDAEKAEAARQARVEQRALWLAWLDRQREVRTLEGPDGEPVEVKLPLPYPLSAMFEMLGERH